MASFWLLAKSVAAGSRNQQGDEAGMEVIVMQDRGAHENSHHSNSDEICAADLSDQEETHLLESSNRIHHDHEVVQIENDVTIRRETENNVVVNNQNNSRSAPATREGDKSDAAKRTNGSKDQGSESNCCSYCVLPKCVRDLLERYKDPIKWFKLWASFLWRIFAFTFDLGLDIALLCDYYVNGDWWYFSLTLFFVLFPSFIISVVNSNYYDEKWEVKQHIKETDDKFSLEEKLIIDPEWKFHLRRIFCLLLVSPLAR